MPQPIVRLSSVARVRLFVLGLLVLLAGAQSGVLRADRRRGHHQGTVTDSTGAVIATLR